MAPLKILSGAGDDVPADPFGEDPTKVFEDGGIVEPSGAPELSPDEQENVGVLGSLREVWARAMAEKEPGDVVNETGKE